MYEYKENAVNALKVNFYHLENIQSTCFNLFGDLKKAKFATSLDKIFIVAKGKFYILTESDISSQNDHSSPKSQAILWKALDVFCPLNSSQVVIYGLDKQNDEHEKEERYVVIYDHIRELIVCKFPLTYNGNSDPTEIRAKINEDQSISLIALAYPSHVLLYRGPFASRKIGTPEEISALNDSSYSQNKFENDKSQSISLLEFGSIHINNKSTDVIFILKKKEGSVFNLVILSANNSKTKLIKNILFPELINIAVLLSPDTLCLSIRREGKSRIKVFTIAINDNDQENFSNQLEIIQNDDISTIFGSSHYFCTFACPKKNRYFYVYDYKYVRDPTAKELDDMTTSSKSHRQSSEEINMYKEIACVYCCKISQDAAIMFSHLNKIYLLDNCQVKMLYEDDLPQIIEKLVSSSMYFEYAKALARMSMPQSVIADIEWKQANYIFKNQQLSPTTRIDRAMDHFICTIGYKSPSDVIQLYMDYNDQALIRYLWGDNEDNPSPNSLIMHSLPGSTEHRRLLISICVMRYSECKTLMDSGNLEKSQPMKILKYLADNKEYSDCWDSLISAFLSIGHRDLATNLAKSSNNCEQAIRIIFDQGISGGSQRLTETKNYIIKLIKEKGLSKERKMKILAEYARELFCINQSRDFVSVIAEFTVSLIYDNNEVSLQYIKQICLLFLPQKQTDSKTVSMNELYVAFYQEVTTAIKIKMDSENDYRNIEEVIPQVMNDVYIQHLLSLSTINERYVYELKESLKHKKYTIDVTILSILDLPNDKENYKFQFFEVIYKTHKEYAAQLIHLIVLSTDDEEHPDAIISLCKTFGKEDPNLFLEAIAEFIRQGRYRDQIPKLLEMSKDIIPLPDIITFLLQLPENYLRGENKLTVKLIKPYVLDWMKEMMEYEESLKQQLAKNQEEFKKLRDPNVTFSKEKLKEVRREYGELVFSAAENIDPYVGTSQSEVTRPFSTLPMDEPPHKLTYGSCLPQQLLKELESGVLFDGLDMINGKVGQPFTEESQKMLSEFDMMYEKVLHYQ